MHTAVDASRKPLAYATSILRANQCRYSTEFITIKYKQLTGALIQAHACQYTMVRPASLERNTKIVICPILSNRGSFRYCLVRKNRTIAKITSTGWCTTLRRLEEVLCASSTPQGPRWQSFHTAKQKQQQNRGTFLKPPDMRPKG